MTLQGVAVAVIVPLCALYALWRLLGAGVRRWVAVQLARVRWPQPIRQRLLRAAQPGDSCGCDGCDHAAPRAGRAPAQTVQIHRRR